MIEEAVALFALAPPDFVAERNRVSAALKRAGRVDDARAVAALRRPKLSEHALNRLARERPEVTARLIVAIDSASSAQAAAIGGNPTDLRSATTELRAATSAVVDAATQLIGALQGGSGEGQRDEINALIRAAATSGDTEALRAGVVGAVRTSDDEHDLFRGAPDPPRTEPRPPTVLQQPARFWRTPTDTDAATASAKRAGSSARVRAAPPSSPPVTRPMAVELAADHDIEPRLRSTSPPDRARAGQHARERRDALVRADRARRDAARQLARAEQAADEAVERLRRAQVQLDRCTTDLDACRRTVAETDGMYANAVAAMALPAAEMPGRS